MTRSSSVPNRSRCASAAAARNPANRCAVSSFNISWFGLARPSGTTAVDSPQISLAPLWPKRCQRRRTSSVGRPSGEASQPSIGRIAKRLPTDRSPIGNARPNAIFFTETGDTLTVTPGGLAKREGETRYFFPDVPGASPKGHLLDEFFECDTPTPKQGMHHPTGLFMLHGKGIRPGLEIKGTNNLDIAPTLLSLMGIPVPAVMKGRVMSEAWGEAPPARDDRAPAQA